MFLHEILLKLSEYTPLHNLQYYLLLSGLKGVGVLQKNFPPLGLRMFSCKTPPFLEGWLRHWVYLIGTGSPFLSNKA